MHYLLDLCIHSDANLKKKKRKIGALIKKTKSKVLGMQLWLSVNLFLDILMRFKPFK